jgi:hypothetical protein
MQQPDGCAVQKQKTRENRFTSFVPHAPSKEGLFFMGLVCMPHAMNSPLIERHQG